METAIDIKDAIRRRIVRVEKFINEQQELLLDSISKNNGYYDVKFDNIKNIIESFQDELSRLNEMEDFYFHYKY